jgi:hypothetical protein
MAEETALKRNLPLEVEAREKSRFVDHSSSLETKSMQGDGLELLAVRKIENRG